MEKYASYFAAERRDSNHAVAQQPKTLWCLLWLDYGKEDYLTLRIKPQQGKTELYRVGQIPYTQAKPKNKGVEAPGQQYRYQHIKGHNASLIIIDSFGNLKSFQQFMKKAFADIRSRKVANLIIDLRNCPGGDSKLCDAMFDYLTDKPYKQMDLFEMKISRQMYEKYGQALKWKKEQIGSTWSMELPPVKPKKNPLRFQGQTFVLVGPKSFSSSAYFASIVKYYGIATVIGEETGDPTSLYGECYNFTLPNSRLQTSVACKTFVFTGSRKDGKGVIPDHEVRQSAEDLSKGVDTVLQFTLDLIKKTNSVKSIKN